MRRFDLVPDCGRCAGVCCVAPSFEASDDFALDKAAGERCPNLTTDHRCRIHDELRVRGFSGCAIYVCYGAGQRATRAFPDDDAAPLRNEAFLVLRVACELLWLATEATALCPPGNSELVLELEGRIQALDRIVNMTGAALLDVDLTSHERAVRALLLRVGTAIGGPARRSLALVG